MLPSFCRHCDTIKPRRLAWTVQTGLKDYYLWVDGVMELQGNRWTRVERDFEGPRLGKRSKRRDHRILLFPCFRCLLNSAAVIQVLCCTTSNLSHPISFLGPLFHPLQPLPNIPFIHPSHSLLLSIPLHSFHL